MRRKSRQSALGIRGRDEKVVEREPRDDRDPEDRELRRILGELFERCRSGLVGRLDGLRFVSFEWIVDGHYSETTKYSMSIRLAMLAVSATPIAAANPRFSSMNAC